MLSGFKKFILRGNALDLAIGVVVGASFGSVMNSLVSDIFVPLIGAILRIPDFSGLFIIINDNPIVYGNFLNSLISLIILMFAIYFFVIVPMNKI